MEKNALCDLSPTEEKILEELLTAQPSVVALSLKVSKQYIATVKSRVNRKEAKTKKFLKKLKKYQRVLHPPRKYKGV